MSALRKAGVWLGLVEEDDERPDEGVFDDDFDEDEDFAPPARTRSLARPRTADRDVAERELFGSRTPRPEPRTEPRSEPRTEPRSESRLADRGSRIPESDLRTDSRADSRTEPPRTDRASVRQLPRPSTTSSISFPTQDNLALAPQVQLRERAVVGEEKPRRYQITTLHPTSYNEARTIGEHFRDGYPVIMNLTDMEEADAKRLVDFAAGLAFGMRGSMERVTNRVFLLSPPNIQVSAEDKARIAQGGFTDQS